MLAVCKNAEAKTYVRPLNRSARGTVRVVKSNTKSAVPVQRLATRVASLDSVSQLLRLKLIIDSLNYDDIVIAFNTGTSTTYNPNEDSYYFPGINAPEGLASYSSDGVKLAINLLPLPKQGQLTIKLDVEAKNSGTLNLKTTQLDSLPALYDIWLVDKYKKDSTNLRSVKDYFFTIDKADTLSFGSNRFTVLVRQTPAAPLKLVDFNATKITAGAQVEWTTQNESNNTHFTVQRSTDGGKNFAVLNTMLSSAIGTYVYIDKTPPAAADQYRVMATDALGITSFTKPVELMYSSSAGIVSSKLSLYPNPTNGVINIAISSGDTSPPAVTSTLSTQALTAAVVSPVSSAVSYNIRIINIKGSVVKSATSSQPTWQDNVVGLTPGTYMIQVLNNTDKKVVGETRFIKF